MTGHKVDVHWLGRGMPATVMTADEPLPLHSRYLSRTPACCLYRGPQSGQGGAGEGAAAHVVACCAHARDPAACSLHLPLAGGPSCLFCTAVRLCSRASKLSMWSSEPTLKSISLPSWHALMRRIWQARDRCQAPLSVCGACLSQFWLLGNAQGAYTHSACAPPESI